MTEMLFGAVNAYNQIMFLFMGAVLLGIGGAVIGYDLYTRRTWTRVSGKIVGAKEEPGSAGKKGPLYTAVFEYTGADGKTRQSLGASSSSFLGDKIPGTRLRLLVNPKDPEDTLRPGWWLLVLGLIFAVPGFFFLARAIMQGGASLLYTPLVLLAAAGYIGFRIKKAIKPRDQWQNHEAFRARVEKKIQTRRDTRKTEGRLLSEAEIWARLRKYDRAVLLWSPLTFLIAVGLLIGAVYTKRNTEDFLSEALRTGGTVVRIESTYSSSSGGSGSYTYYPVVGFVTEAGASVEVRDRVGSNPPSFRRGDAVSVLYDPNDPQSAWIDRGAWNWALPAGLGAGGTLLLFLTLWNIGTSRGRLRESRRYVDRM